MRRSFLWAPQNFANCLPGLGIASLRLRFATSAHRDPSRPSRADSAQKRVVFFDSAQFAFRRHAQSLPTTIASILALRSSCGHALRTIDDKQIMTAHEVAAYLRLHRVTVYRLVAEGRLHPFKVGRLLRFNRSDVLASMRRLLRVMADRTNQNSPRTVLAGYCAAVIRLMQMRDRKKQLSPLASRSWVETPVLQPCVTCGERRCTGPRQHCETCRTRIADAARIIRARFVH